MQPNDIKNLIEHALPNAQAIVHGEDGVHFEAIVICEDFAGKTLLQQHRMVYTALGNRMQNEAIHALALKTYTPDAWQKRQA